MIHPLLPVPLDHTSHSAFPLLSTRLWLFVLTHPVGHLICNFRHHIASVLPDVFLFSVAFLNPSALSSLCWSGPAHCAFKFVFDCSLVDPYRIYEIVSYLPMLVDWSSFQLIMRLATLYIGLYLLYFFTSVHFVPFVLTLYSLYFRTFCTFCTFCT